MDDYASYVDGVKKFKGKLSYKLKKGYKVVAISSTSGELKNNSKLSSNTTSLYITIQDKKTKAQGEIFIAADNLEE